MLTDIRHIFLIICFFLAGCADSPLTSSISDVSMTPIAELKAKLSFTCTHEVIPEASADTEVLFKYARWLQKGNQLKGDPATDAQIERLYRIAADNGNFKANINLQNGGIQRQFQVLDDEHLRLSQELIDANVASGYYLMSVLLEQGGAGLQQDSDMALRYLSKAASTGSAQAQFFVAEKLAPRSIAPDIARKMWRCAAEQGHGQAAIALGVDLKNRGDFQGALEIFQLGASAGNSNAAGRLHEAFRTPSSTNELLYLAQEEDSERSDRYEKIWRILHNYSYANPKVPEINDIVPLPPAKLPEWDGKLKWLEEREANIPPLKPSEELINKLADAAKLERATGRPMPGAKGFSQAHLSVPYDCKTFGGNICPVSGYWKVETHWRLGTPDGKPIIRYFTKGQTFPAEQMRYEKKRRWPLSPQWLQGLVNVRWYLV